MGKGVRILLVITLLAVSTLLVSAGIVLYNTSSAKDHIFEGIYVNDVNIGKMSREEAAGVLEEKFNKPVSGKVITLSYEDSEYPLKYSDLNVHYDIDTILNNSFEYGKSGNIISNTISRLKLKRESVNMDMEYKYDNTVVDKVIKEISGKLYKAPKDARISFNGTSFKVTPHEQGLSVNETELRRLISEALVPESSIDNITIPVEVQNAKITGEMLSKIDTRLSSYTTSFKPSDVNRTENVRIATVQINGALILPGEVFSMNKTLGPRAISKGYKEAPVIINGTIVPGLAGGICQVTSTIYNAALLSNFEIVERRQHGVAVAYVPTGRDATISGDVIDFKFKNTNKYPVYVHTTMGKSTLTVSLYGANEHPGQNVQITSEVTERIQADIEYINDPSLSVGAKITEEKPITGLKSKTYKKVYKDGKLISTELLSQDYYKPVKGKIRVGTKPVSMEPDPPTQPDPGTIPPDPGTIPPDTGEGGQPPTDGVFPDPSNP